MQAARLGSAVVFVRDLDASVAFYQDVLALTVADHSTTAALLSGTGGSQLVLRAMGGGAAHALGSVGVQFLVWSAASRDDLDSAEQVLRHRGAFRDVRTAGLVTAVAGRDPDGITVMILHPGPDEVPMQEIPVQIYAW